MIEKQELSACSHEVSKEWIIFQFVEDMTFDNYDSIWNFDHTVPFSFFIVLHEKEVRKYVDLNKL